MFYEYIFILLEEYYAVSMLCIFCIFAQKLLESILTMLVNHLKLKSSNNVILYKKENTQKMRTCNMFLIRTINRELFKLS